MKTDSHSQEDFCDMMAPTLEDDASSAFVQRLHGDWNEEDQRALDSRLRNDPHFADAYRRVAQSWDSLEEHAEAPQLLAHRQAALTIARGIGARSWLGSIQSSPRRWRLAAAIVGAALVGALVWQLSPYGYRPGEYRTGIGEQRIVELSDHSRIVLDAASRIRVRFSDQRRIVELQSGQAQFYVTRNPARPFEVQAAGDTIVDLGTVFTVDLTDHQVSIAILEGQVAVTPWHPSALPSVTSPLPSSITTPAAPSGNGVIDLSAGQELQLSRDGQSTLIPHADLDAATAWREGTVIFRNTPLSEAVRRMNRYSSVQLHIEGNRLENEQINGVFQAGDTRGFIEAIQRYLPVAPEYTDGGNVVLIRASAEAR